jgi:hypothetical protein
MLPDYCNTSAAWAIIRDSQIKVEYEDDIYGWMASGCSLKNGLFIQYDHNPLRAAMIVYLLMEV